MTRLQCPNCDETFKTGHTNIPGEKDDKGILREVCPRCSKIMDECFYCGDSFEEKTENYCPHCFK